MSTPTSPTPKRKHKPAGCPDAPLKRSKLTCDQTDENFLLQLDRGLANERLNRQHDLLNMQLELQKVKDLEMLPPLVCFLPPQQTEPNQDLPEEEDWLLEYVKAVCRNNPLL